MSEQPSPAGPADFSALDERQMLDRFREVAHKAAFFMPPLTKEETHFVFFLLRGALSDLRDAKEEATLDGCVHFDFAACDEMIKLATMPGKRSRCPECGDDGTVVVEDEPADGFKRHMRVPCPKCNGIPSTRSVRPIHDLT